MTFVLLKGLIMMEMFVLDIAHLSVILIMINVPVHRHQTVVNKLQHANRKTMIVVVEYALKKHAQSYVKLMLSIIAKEQ